MECMVCCRKPSTRRNAIGISRTAAARERQQFEEGERSRVRMPMTIDGGQSTSFSATAAALGYLYQVRLSLLWSLERRKTDASFSVYVETLDDVVFGQDGQPLELLQTKHHGSRSANLSDSSADLWKSLRVWMAGRAAGTIPRNARLFLITTAGVSEHSAAACLLTENRNAERAVEILSSVAGTTSNQQIEPSCALFRGLDQDDRTALLQSVEILPQAPSVFDVGESLRQEASMAVNRERLDSFLARLEGWWFRRVLEQMQGSFAGAVSADVLPIRGEELETTIDDLREQLSRDSLPVDESILDTVVAMDDYKDHLFVRQAELSGTGNRRVLGAVRDYYRAFEHRSRWMREDLLHVGELNRYERHLTEEWTLEFERLADGLGDAAAEEAKQAAAQEVYSWVERNCLPIREKVLHPSISRGSFHMLADELRVGWHPDFLSRLEHLLERRDAS